MEINKIKKYQGSNKLVVDCGVVGGLEVLRDGEKM